MADAVVWRLKDRTGSEPSVSGLFFNSTGGLASFFLFFQGWYLTELLPRLTLIRAMLYFCVGRESSGEIVKTVSTPCDTLKDCMARAATLRNEGYTEVWIEDDQGNRIEDNDSQERMPDE